MIEQFLEEQGIENIFSHDLRDKLKIQRFKPGEIVVRSGQEIKSFLILIEGRGKVYTDQENGKSLLVRFYAPGDLIGEVELFTNKPCVCTVEALTPLICLAMDYDDLKGVMNESPKLLNYFCCSLSHKLISFNISSSINLTYPLENRLAAYLLAMSGQGGESVIDGIHTANMGEQADLLGTSYRHLSRTLKNLCDKKIISKKGKIIEIINLQGLKNLAGDIYS